jgi:hypothetical protein
LKHGLGAAPEEAAAVAIAAATASNGTEGCLADPLLHLLLMRAVNYDLALERFLAAVRRRLTLAEAIPAGIDGFLAALALQGFNNGYVLAASEEETRRASARKAEIETELSGGTRLTSALEQKLLRFAFYAPLTEIAGASRLLGFAREGAAAPLRLLLERCLAEPLEEAELARALPSLGTIADPVSRAVQA